MRRPLSTADVRSRRGGGRTVRGGYLTRPPPNMTMASLRRAPLPHWETGHTTSDDTETIDKKIRAVNIKMADGVVAVDVRAPKPPLPIYLSEGVTNECTKQVCWVLRPSGPHRVS
jgi:hypothetical protein